MYFNSFRLVSMYLLIHRQTQQEKGHQFHFCFDAKQLEYFKIQGKVFSNKYTRFTEKTL